jgi:hypothetical protein
MDELWELLLKIPTANSIAELGLPDSEADE